MDMGFWCGGMERLLCVDVGKAYAFAGNAPDVDVVAAIANSTTYGGAGYPSSDLATAAARNGLSVDLLLHELGHGLGDLADEYDYGDGATYYGSEPSERNVSILSAAEMEASGTKWAAWLGVNDPFYDGLVSTYEGARYYQYGIYRPTTNSIMRTLGRPFNLPSAESIVLELYDIVSPIDGASATLPVYTGMERLWVEPLRPEGHDLVIEWRLDGQLAGSDEVFDLCTAELGMGAHEVELRVVDPTDLVRDEAAREAVLTDYRRYDIDVGTGTRDFGLWGFDQAVAGAPAVLGASCATPGAAVYFAYARARGAEPVPGCAPLLSDLADPVLLGVGVADGGGQATIEVQVPPGVAGRTFYVQAVEPETCRLSLVGERSFPRRGGAERMSNPPPA